jgi:hypothetical protein
MGEIKTDVNAKFSYEVTNNSSDVSSLDKKSIENYDSSLLVNFNSNSKNDELDFTNVLEKNKEPVRGFEWFTEKTNVGKEDIKVTLGNENTGIYTFTTKEGKVYEVDIIKKEIISVSYDESDDIMGMLSSAGITGVENSQIQYASDSLSDDNVIFIVTESKIVYEINKETKELIGINSSNAMGLEVLKAAGVKDIDNNKAIKSGNISINLNYYTVQLDSGLIYTVDLSSNKLVSTKYTKEYGANALNNAGIEWLLFHEAKELMIDGLQEPAKKEKIGEFYSLSEEETNRLSLEQIKEISKDENNSSNIIITLMDGTVYTINESINKVSSITYSNGEAYYFDENGIIINSKNGHSIFDEKNIANESFGGSQINFQYNCENLLEDPDIRKILTEEFPNATEEDYYLYLQKITNIGCAYTAKVNSIFQHFDGDPKGFEKIFGFPMYKISSDGSGAVVLNYEPLILEFYTYYQKEKKGFENIEDIYGNIQEIIDSEQTGDAALNNIKMTGSDGMRAKDGNVFSQFLKERYDILVGVKLDRFSLTVKTVNKRIEEGRSVQIMATGFDLYEVVENEDGSISRGEQMLKDVGSHEMTITRITKEKEIVVSSWGKEYIIDTRFLSVELYETISYADASDVEKYNNFLNFIENINSD